MLREKKAWLAGLVIGMVMLMATPAFARSISIKDGGIALWIFIIVGALIILLQLIPAGILFFSFIGTTSSMVFKRKSATEEVREEEKGKVAVPGYEPATAEK